MSSATLQRSFLLVLFLAFAAPRSAWPNETTAVLPVFEPTAAIDPEHVRLTRLLRTELRERRWTLQDLDETRRQILPHSVSDGEIRRRIELGQKLVYAGASKEAATAFRDLATSIESGLTEGQHAYQLWVKTQIWIALAELNVQGDPAAVSLTAASNAIERVLLMEPPTSAQLDEFREKVPPKFRESIDTALRAVTKRPRHRLTITSAAPGATVYVNAKLVGVTPISLVLPAGSYWVRGVAGDQRSPISSVSLTGDRGVRLDFSTLGPIRDQPELSLALPKAERNAALLRLASQLGTDRLIATRYSSREKRFTAGLYDSHAGALVREGTIAISSRAIGELSDFLGGAPASNGVTVSFPLPKGAPAPSKPERLGTAFELRQGEALALLSVKEPSTAGLTPGFADATQTLRNQFGQRGVALQPWSETARRLGLVATPAVEELDQTCTKLEAALEGKTREEVSTAAARLVDQIEQLPLSNRSRALRTRALLIWARAELATGGLAQAKEIIERLFVSDGFGKQSPQPHRWSRPDLAVFDSVRAQVRERPMRKLRVTSAGPAVRLIVDGRPAGKTPATITLRAGKHVVRGMAGARVMPPTQVDLSVTDKALTLQPKYAAALQGNPIALTLPRGDQPAGIMSIGEWSGAAGVIATRAEMIGAERVFTASLYDVRAKGMVREGRVKLDGGGLSERLDALAFFLMVGEPSDDVAAIYPTSSQPQPKGLPGEEAAALAKAHYNSGRAFFAKKRYREAIKEFELAIEAKPHPFIYFNLAECHERLGDSRSRLRNLRDYLRMLPNAEDRAHVLRVMTELEAKLQRPDGQALIVESQPTEAEVWIDAEVRGWTPFRAELYLGTYDVTVLKPGYEPYTARIELQRNRPLRLELTLKGSSTPAQSAAAALAMTQKANAPDLSVAPPSSLALPSQHPPPPRKRVWTWVAGGVGGAALATGIIMGTLAKKRSDEMVSGIHSQTTVQRLHDQARTYQRTANIMYGIAGAAGAAGVGLFFLEGSF